VTSRRQLLSGIGSVSIVAVAGCVSGSESLVPEEVSPRAYLEWDEDGDPPELGTLSHDGEEGVDVDAIEIQVESDDQNVTLDADAEFAADGVQAPDLEPGESFAEGDETPIVDPDATIAEPGGDYIIRVIYHPADAILFEAEGTVPDDTSPDPPMVQLEWTADEAAPEQSDLGTLTHSGGDDIDVDAIEIQVESDDQSVTLDADTEFAGDGVEAPDLESGEPFVVGDSTPIDADTTVVEPGSDYEIRVIYHPADTIIFEGRATAAEND